VYLLPDFTLHMLQEKNDHMVGTPHIKRSFECISAFDLHFVSANHLSCVILTIYPKKFKTESAKPAP
jgi:hypothetical protein